MLRRPIPNNLQFCPSNRDRDIKTRCPYYIKTEIENSSRVISGKSDRKKLSRDISELIRAKNAALSRAGKYPTCENRTHVRALQREDPHEGKGAVPAVKKPGKSVALYDREKAKVEEQVGHKISLPPKDNLDLITQNEVSKHIKALKIRKALGIDSITSKALKCFSAPLLAVLVVIFNACIKDTVTFLQFGRKLIRISKPGKPRDLSASYRPISILSVLDK
ncbi:hypothetical protein EVAR_101810_1 [Eumeta japonica]|uniref:RNA-directed DNA polymerase from transposon BS n=1 Tax=Eumeta variegata TaxID=151549 RepID=A0A4C1SMU0_EUMVA|nr:hypothetical protein EVAR_101810_1 [Eumeta japonica]